MSQFYVGTTASSLPPSVAEEFDTQDGNAVPLAHILIVNGIDSRENNDNGIITKGGSPATPFSNEVDVVITNRLQGIVSTTGAVTSPIITFTPTVIGTYSLEIRIAAYNETPVPNLGAGYSLFGCARFDGVNSNLCGTVDKVVNEEGAMSSANVTMTVSGANILINAVGYSLPPDQEINWSAVALYTFVGVV